MTEKIYRTESKEAKESLFRHLKENGWMWVTGKPLNVYDERGTKGTCWFFLNERCHTITWSSDRVWVEEEYNSEDIEEWKVEPEGVLVKKPELPWYMEEFMERIKNDDMQRVNYLLFEIAINDVNEVRHRYHWITDDMYIFCTSSANEYFYKITLAHEIGYTIAPRDMWVVRTSGDYYFEAFDGDADQPLAFDSIEHKQDATKFSNRRRAELIAELINGTVEQYAI